MLRQNWKDVAELVGMAAIVASLIFVGYQLKQDRDIANAEAFQARAVASAESARDVAANENALRGIIRARFSVDPSEPMPAGIVPEELSDVPAIELYAASLHQLSAIFIWDNSHFQYTHGFLPESHWQRVRATIEEGLRNDPVTRFSLRNFSYLMRPEFRRELDLIVEKMKAEKSGR